MIQSGARTEVILRQYEQHLGEASDIHVYGSESLKSPIHITRYDNVIPGASVLLTAGLSGYSAELGGAHEVVLVASTHVDEISDFLIAAVRFAIKQKLPITYGFSLQGLSAINPSLAKSSGKEALYFTSLSGLPAQIVAIDNESDAKLLNAILISAAENDYFLDNGAEALESKLSQQRATANA
ncbi:MAG TPA: suppressor of fused domain protein [Capsulimonadaceae bacterium]|jgi:hypothetical protein